MLAQNNAQNASGISRLYFIHINSFIQRKTSAEGTLHVFVANPTCFLISLFVFFVVVKRNGKDINEWSSQKNDFRDIAKETTIKLCLTNNYAVVT